MMGVYVSSVRAPFVGASRRRRRRRRVNTGWGAASLTKRVHRHPLGILLINDPSKRWKINIKSLYSSTRS